MPRAKAILLAVMFLSSLLTAQRPRFKVETYTLNAMPQSLTVIDVNGDGRPDLVVGTNSTVAVFLGNADGTFQAPKYSDISVSACGGNPEPCLWLTSTETNVLT
jgi:hypothetical protein